MPELPLLVLPLESHGPSGAATDRARESDPQTPRTPRSPHSAEKILSPDRVAFEGYTGRDLYPQINGSLRRHTELHLVTPEKQPFIRRLDAAIERGATHNSGVVRSFRGAVGAPIAVEGKTYRDPAFFSTSSGASEGARVQVRRFTHEGRRDAEGLPEKGQTFVVFGKSASDLFNLNVGARAFRQQRELLYPRFTAFDVHFAHEFTPENFEAHRTRRGDGNAAGAFDAPTLRRVRTEARASVRVEKATIEQLRQQRVAQQHVIDSLQTNPDVSRDVLQQSRADMLAIGRGIDAATERLRLAHAKTLGAVFADTTRRVVVLSERHPEKDPPALRRAASSTLP